ncbi:hypothetical protein D3C78_1471320 [compost metagenome]
MVCPPACMNSMKWRTTSSSWVGASSPEINRSCSDNADLPSAAATSCSLPRPSGPTTVFHCA